VKKALVVGINGYGFPNDLPSSTRDAEAFGNVLDTVYRFDHVRVLRDGDATRDGVDRGLEWLCQSANTNDRLVAFFRAMAVGSSVTVSSRKRWCSRTGASSTITTSPTGRSTCRRACSRW
jgi:hypothetical protein